MASGICPTWRPRTSSMTSCAPSSGPTPQAERQSAIDIRRPCTARAMIDLLATARLRLVPFVSRDGPVALVVSGAVTGGRHIAGALRLGVGGAQQWFVGRAEVGGGQAIWVEPPDL